MAQIELRGVKKSFDDGTMALRGASLSVRDGEFLTLTGPVGCGKTTLLRLIAGLEKPDAGEILFDGCSVIDQDPLRRGAAMVFQNYSLYPDRSVYRNIAFPLETLHTPEKEKDERVREMARRLGLEHLLDRMPAALSGGEKQRVAIARALVRQPSVFLLDEPFSGLDEAMRRNACALLQELRDETGTTCIYVTHDREEAMELSDRVAVMEGGVILQTDPPMQIFHNPASARVAQLLRPEQMRQGQDGLWLEEKMAPGGRVLFGADGRRTSADIPVTEGAAPRTRPAETEQGEETPAGRGFFRTAFEELLTLLFLNLLFLISCIFIVTIPAALTALCGICLKLRRGEQVRLLKDYFYLLRRDFTRALGGGAVLAALAGLAGYGIFFYGQLSASHSLLLLPGIVTMLLLICVIITSFYFFPMNAMIDLPVLVLLRNSLVLSALEIRRSLAALALFLLLGVFAGAGLWPYSLVYLLLLSFSLQALALVYIVSPAVEKRVAVQH